MKRSPLLRRAPLARTSSLVTRKSFARVSELKRTPMKRKPRRARKGDNKRLLAFVRSLPCVVGGKKCRPSQAHHAIEMGGPELPGMGSTAPDSETLPLCATHHQQFHRSQGFCKGWTSERRRIFQRDEIDRVTTVWAELQETGVMVEPMREAI